MSSSDEDPKSKKSKVPEVYLIARYVHKDDEDGEVFFVKKDFRYKTPRLVCSCEAYLIDMIKAGGEESLVIPQCRHTEHAHRMLLEKGHEGRSGDILLDRAVPDEIIETKNERVPFWWIERNVTQYVI